MKQVQASSRPSAVQAVKAIALAVAITALGYSNWFHDCCNAARNILGILLLPGSLIGLLLAGGNVHGASEFHFYIGISVQFYLVVWLVRWIQLRRRAQ